GLTAGSYTATVTDDNGCIANATTSPTITQPTELLISTSFTDATCFVANNGTATVTAAGGTPGYTYSWTPSGGTGSTATSLAPGTYNVLVTDANSCTANGNVTIAQPTALTASIVSTSNVSCFGGSDGAGTVSASGGTPGYLFSWAPYGGTLASASGLSSGAFTVTVTDANACTTNVVVNITQPATGVTATATSTPTSCNAGTNGTATAVPSGGTPGYTYSWSPGGATGITATGLSAGSYTVAVTDAEGCVTMAATTVNEPTVITATVTPTSSTCGNANGSAAVGVSGGTGPFTYAWTPSGGTAAIATSLAAGVYNVLVTDANGCTQSASGTVTNIAGPTLSLGTITNVSCFGGNNGSASVIISGGTGPFTSLWTPSGGTSTFGFLLSAGTYTYNVTDANGCTNSINATITQPTPLAVSFPLVGNVSCNGGNDGSIGSSASGGTAPYTYAWSPSGGSGASASSLTAGTYTLTVTDDNWCTTSGSSSVTEPSVLVVNLVNSTDPACNNGSNGSIEAIAGGGTAPYSYVWNTTPVQTGTIATALAAGIYTVTVTDANGCTALLNNTLNNPTAVSTVAGLDDTLCLGNSTIISATASGGSGSFFYDWTPGAATTAGISVNPATTTEYIVTAYDNNGCAGNTDTLVVVVYNLTGAVFDVIAYSPICPGISTTVYASVLGDQGPLTYAWNNGLAPGPGAFLTTPTVDPTYYICTVTNSCGASVTDSAMVTFNPPPVISFSSDTAQGCSPLVVTFIDQSTTVSNDSIVEWTWDFGDGTIVTDNDSIITHTFVGTGTYLVTLDLLTWGGCTNNSGSAPYVVTVFPDPVANFTVSSYELNLPYDNIACINGSSGAVSYSWNFGDGSTTTLTNPIHTYNTIGYFDITLTATNSFGCTDTHTETVHCISDIVFPNAFTPNPDGSNGGEYDITDFSNNVFFPFTSGVDTYRLLIFNRWGELIFESTDVNKGWDGYYRGALCTQDVYVWKADVTFIDGREFNATGDLTLLR
ncbi:MAG TPA: PKD domain-containing protein, partial [Flavobacteriales bacterium]|nr:PKD domain-containing protein [Flavobacteriales bacterium]